MAQTDEKNTGTTDEKKPAFEGEFDAERAARLIENLRSEIKDLKAEKATLATSLQEKEDAEKTESQRLSDRLAAAEKAAKDAQRALLVERAARKHNLPEDVVDFLIGDTEEEIEAKAERLARLGSPKKDEPNEEQKPEDDGLPGRPAPALKPGHGGDSSAPFDPREIAKEALAGR